MVKGADFNATVPGVLGGRGPAGVGDPLALDRRPRRRRLPLVVDLAIRDEVTQANYGNVFLLMIAGPVVGYLCESLGRDGRRA